MLAMIRNHSDDLAPLRRVEALQAQGRSEREIVRDLQMLFGIDAVDAMAAIAATNVLAGRGLPVPAERP